MATRNYDDAVDEHTIEVGDEPVTVIVIDDTDDSRIIVEADRRYELIVDDGWAYPKWEDRSRPRWLESVVCEFGVHGIRTGVRGGK
jgi:hypothetical protein